MTAKKEEFDLLRSWGPLFPQSFNEWSEDHALHFSAALAYNSIFAMTPLVVIAIAVAGLVFGEQAARGQVWIYYSTTIFLLGAEFTKVYADRYGSGIHPSRNACFASELARPAPGPGKEPTPPA